MNRYLLLASLLLTAACGQTGKKAADAQQADGRSADSMQVDDGVAAPDVSDARGPGDGGGDAGKGDASIDVPEGTREDEVAMDSLSVDLVQDLATPPEVNEDAPDLHVDAPVLPDAGADAYEGGGVFGTAILTSGDCMPPAPPTCAQGETLTSGDIYFVNVSTEESHTAWWVEDEYHVHLPDGEYYVWPDIGWNSGAVAKECWEELAQCSDADYDFVKGDFDYMADKAKCTSDSLWQSHDRCNVVVSGAVFRVDIDIDNVAY